MINKIASARGGSPIANVKPGGKSGNGNANQQASFGAMLQQASGGVSHAGNAHNAGNANTVGVNNADAHTANIASTGTAAGTGINFSKHALARAEERGIELTPDLMNRLAGSVEKAQEKGAKNILAFDTTQAFIINIPYGRVITTMSQAEMRDNIFTNIDGAVLL